jgi:putative transposase
MLPHRRLPHNYGDHDWLFVTWHLHGSLPQPLYPPATKPLSAGEAFVWIDRHLDRTERGPRYLTRPDIAEIVMAGLRAGVELRNYELRAFVLMPNHVHVLLRLLIDPSRALRGLKGCTAREANRILGRTGEPFWQHESYDHLVRNTQEMERIVAYIHNNPVWAGLARAPEEYRWSSASS